MESMEPKDIDWSRVVSRYVRDETYEGIEAPHWADLADPEAGAAAVDDETWFCRPDCRHPKTAEDFLKLSPSPKGKLLRSVSAMMPFGERDTNLRDGNNNLKRRGAVAGGGIATFTPPKPKAAAKKRFQDDSENQDPALATPPPPPPASRPPFGAARWAKNAKDAIKSSAEKRPDNAEKEALLSKNAAPRQLKSTLSARNLFSGKDILGQISDFYNELKRMAAGNGSRPASETMEELSPSPMNKDDVAEKKVDRGCGADDQVPSEEAIKEKARQETAEKSPSPMKGKKIGLKVEAGKPRSSVLKEVKATPPTPQRFPSPSVNRVKNVKAGGMSMAGSLKKPLKEKGTPSKDLENRKDANRQPFGVKDMNSTKVCDAEGSSSGMFWFLKPCTFLVE
ncbi:hypothetical protein E2562_019422 [Oryza meyeriana var. granulata]|uniref:Uncharacterized protein n=1 Tax=Oryza meyeriana var. granulata TaxID=110450 RepID=A0A6G1DL52_9ORYZ|nr:hypothetical protein E2562_019422 [Oryza meyeriana var. granulata]